MPVVGTICCRTGQPARFEDCIQCAKTGSPGRCVHPLHLLESMRSNESSRKGAGLSTTTLLGCHRRAQLHQRADYYEDPDNVEARFKGTLIHEGMERLVQGHDDVIMEKRYGRFIGGEYITGKMDMILPDFEGGARIVDFKSAGRRKLGPDMIPTESHIEQVNIYRWIVENGFETEPTVEVLNGDDSLGYTQTHEYKKSIKLKVGSAAILYIGDTGMQEVDVPLWPIEKTQLFVEAKYAEYTAKRLAPILPDKTVRSKGTVGQAQIVWADDEEVEVVEPGLKVEPHWMCKNCALFDICRSLPQQGVEWNDYDEYDSNP